MPAPAPKSPAAPGHRLAHPQAANDLLMYRLNRLIAVAGSLVVRLCEGGYGITRREWGLMMMLAQHPGMPPAELAQRLGLDRARTSRAITAPTACAVDGMWIEGVCRMELPQNGEPAISSNPP